MTWSRFDQFELVEVEENNASDEELERACLAAQAAESVAATKGESRTHCCMWLGS